MQNWKLGFKVLMIIYIKQQTLPHGVYFPAHERHH